MATRRRSSKALTEYSWVLESGDVANQGEAAGLDTATGTMRPMGKSSTQIHVGFFAETLTGDGTTKVRVSLPAEVEAEWLANDSAPNDIAAADIGSEVYAKDGKTVSTLSTSRSKAGIVLDYDSDGNRVLVLGGLRWTGATGASGFVGTVATRTALAAVASGSRADGQVVQVLADGSRWAFVAASTLTQDGGTVEGSHIVIQPGSGTGRWVRQDQAFDLKLPIDHTTADAAALTTVPTGYALRITGLPYWDVGTGFTGGSSSAIGVSSDATGATTKGDLLGGAGGDVTATLGTAGVKPGTLGGKLDTLAHIQAIVIGAGKIVRFDRVVDAFTAGAGFVHIPVSLALIG